jgi:outer membrane lipoprotein SlyB
MKNVFALSLVLLLAACSTSSPDVISRADAQRMSTVEDGTLLSIRTVTVAGSQSGIGGTVGGVVGGLAGYGSGGNQSTNQIAGVLAAVAGAAAGNAIEKVSTREDAFEILVQLKNGDRRAIVQAKGGEVLEPGDKVIIVSSGGKVRVTKAPVVVK